MHVWSSVAKSAHSFSSDKKTDDAISVVVLSNTVNAVNSCSCTMPLLFRETRSTVYAQLQLRLLAVPDVDMADCRRC